MGKLVKGNRKCPHCIQLLQRSNCELTRFTVSSSITFNTRTGVIVDLVLANSSVSTRIWHAVINVYMWKKLIKDKYHRIFIIYGWSWS